MNTIIPKIPTDQNGRPLCVGEIKELIHQGKLPSWVLPPLEKRTVRDYPPDDTKMVEKYYPNGWQRW